MSNVLKQGVLKSCSKTSLCGRVKGQFYGYFFEKRSNFKALLHNSFMWRTDHTLVWTRCHNSRGVEVHGTREKWEFSGISLFNRILRTRKMPDLQRHSRHSIVVCLYKNKGDI